MSPEQARGHNVDKRADIWAFGCVLFEMLTGRVAFAGDTASDTIAKILEREPDWSALPSATPVAVRRLLFRCLAKDSKQRLRDVGDVRIEIDAINEVVPGAADVTGCSRPSAPGRHGSRGPSVAALAAGVIVWEVRRPTAIENPLATARFSRLTDWAGAESSRGDLIGRQVRGLPRGSRGSIRSLGEPGWHLEVYESHARQAAARFAECPSPFLRLLR